LGPFAGAQPTPRFGDRPEIPAKDFLFQKSPQTDIERVACLGFYLAHYRDTPHFKTIDISRLNTEAAQIKFSNGAFAVADATNAGLLTRQEREISNYRHWVSGMSRHSPIVRQPRRYWLTSRPADSANRITAKVHRLESHPECPKKPRPVKITIYNHKGGVGKTTLSVNIASALVALGKSVLLVDSDPQCNLTSYLLSDDVVDDLLNKSDGPAGATIWTGVRPVINQMGEVVPIPSIKVGGLRSLPGDIRMSEYEEFSGRFMD
jgi:hypothetical protein